MLNFAMFRSVFERGSRLGAGPFLRLWRSVLTFFSRWWQIESLYRANAKYRPVWEPRFLLFAKSSDIPRIGLASARAEGFLTAPGFLTRSHFRTGLPIRSAGPAGPALVLPVQHGPRHEPEPQPETEPERRS